MESGRHCGRALRTRRRGDELNLVGGQWRCVGQSWGGGGQRGTMVGGWDGADWSAVVSEGSGEVYTRANRRLCSEDEVQPFPDPWQA